MMERTFVIVISVHLLLLASFGFGGDVVRTKKLGKEKPRNLVSIRNSNEQCYFDLKEAFEHYSLSLAFPVSSSSSSSSSSMFPSSPNFLSVTDRTGDVIAERYTIERVVYPLPSVKKLLSLNQNLNTFKRGVYELKANFAQGSFGSVYYAFDPLRKRRVVLKKMFTSNAKFRFNGEREVYFNNLLKYEPHFIVRFIESFTRKEEKTNMEELWLVFEDEGKSLSSFLYENRKGVLTPSKFWVKLRQYPYIRREIARHLVYGLNVLRKHKVLCHRDLKPANILIKASDESPIKIGDFGSALNDYVLLRKEKYFIDDPSQEEETKNYSPPSIDSNRFINYDSWSLGITLLEILLGVNENIFTYFEGKKKEKRRKRKKSEAKKEDVYTQFGLYNISIFNSSVLFLDQTFKRGFFDDSNLGGFELDFIFRLLKVNGNERMSVAEMMKHPYIAGEREKEERKKDMEIKVKEDGTHPAQEKDLPQDVVVANSRFVCDQCKKKYSSFQGCVDHAHAFNHSSLCLSFSPFHFERPPSSGGRQEEELNLFSSFSLCSAYGILKLEENERNNVKVCGNRGGRRYSEDFFYFERFETKSPTWLLLLADGHNGEFAAREGIRLIAQSFRHGSVREGEERVLAIERMNEEESRKENFLESGTAITIIKREANKIHAYNLGDVRAIIFSNEKNQKNISLSHTLLNEKEKERVKNDGGSIINRNGIERINGKLVITRVFGDGSMKPLVSSRPSYFFVDLEQSEESFKYLLIGSDGFFDVMKEPVKFFFSLLEREKESNPKREESEIIDVVVRRMMLETLARAQGTDNVLISIVIL